MKDNGERVYDGLSFAMRVFFADLKILYKADESV